MIRGYKEFFMKEHSKPKISLVGVGGAGCKLVNNISQNDLYNEVKTVAVSGKNFELESSSRY